MAPQSNKTQICQSNKQRHKKPKKRQTGTGRGYAGTINPRGTQKLDNPLKVIQNPNPWNPDNPLKGIWDLVQNRTWSQWPRGLTLPTLGQPQQPRVDINLSIQPLIKHTNGVQLVYIQPSALRHASKNQGLLKMTIHNNIYNLFRIQFIFVLGPVL